MVKKLTIVSYLEPLTRQTTLHLAEISRELKLPHTNVRKYMAKFEGKGILKKTTLGRLNFYKINKDAPMIDDYMTILEKSKLIDTVEKSLRMKEFVSFLHKEFSDIPCLIFGSSVNNEKAANDIDLLIVTSKKIESKIEEFSKKINKKIHIVKVSHLSSVNDVLKEEIHKKHLIINGSEEIVRWLL